MSSSALPAQIPDAAVPDATVPDTDPASAISPAISPAVDLHSLPEAARAWLLPLDDDQPAGPWLEYDTAYTALQARMLPPVEVQYGDFTQRREAPPWQELERECEALLLRSRDITLLVWWLRCRVRRAGAQGLCEGLRVCVRVLRRFGEHVHPQLRIDGELDPALRANALALLTDPDGLLGDLRDVVACRGVGGSLRVRDIEREWGAGEARRAPCLEQLRAAWRAREPELQALHDAHGLLDTLHAWARNDLGEHAPDLGSVQRLLAPFGASNAGEPAGPAVRDGDGVDEGVDEGVDGGVDEGVDEEVGGPADEAPRPQGEPPSAPRVGSVGEPAPDDGVAAPCQGATAAAVAPAAGGQPALPADRAGAQACIARARDWFEQHEPSSPVGVLLRQAERLVGKRYAEVAQAIPPDLLARWDAP